MTTTNTTDADHAPVEIESEKVSSRVVGGVTRCSTASDSVSEEINTTSVSSLSGVAPGNIMATMQTSYGSPTSTMSPSSTVELQPGNPASRTSLAVAESLGMVKRNGLGIYEAVGEASLEAAPEASPEGTQGPELFAAADEAQFAAAIADIPQPLYDQAVISAAMSVAATGDIKDLAASLAATCGLPTEQLQAAQASATAMFQSQADSAISALGIAPEDFYTWARANHGEQLGRAVREQVTARSVEGYRVLAKSYLDLTPPSLDALTTAGLETKQAKPRGNNDMVFIHDTWMEVKTAARIGLI